MWLPGAQHSQARQTEKVRHSVFVWQVGPLSSRCHPTLWTGVLTHDGAAAQPHRRRVAVRRTNSRSPFVVRAGAVPRTYGKLRHLGMSSQSAGPSLRRARAQRACRARQTCCRKGAPLRVACSCARTELTAFALCRVPCGVPCALQSGSTSRERGSGLTSTLGPKWRRWHV